MSKKVEIKPCIFCQVIPEIHGAGTYNQICCDNFNGCCELHCAPPGATPLEAAQNWNVKMTFLQAQRTQAALLHLIADDPFINGSEAKCV